jgi:hypothetical protein
MFAPKALPSGISILDGHGDATFEPKVDYETLGNPSSIAVGRFDRDRKPNLAVAIGSEVAGFINDC